MMSGFSLIIVVTLSVLNHVHADDDGHHHHVIIHVPYKIHTIHHIKHIHHQKKGEGKYEVLGYTIGKPIDLSHQLGDHHHYETPLPPPPPPPPVPLHHHEPPAYHHHLPEEAHHHEFSAGNELGYGHEWAPSYGHEFQGDGYYSSGSHFDSHANFAGGPKFAGHHENVDGYD